jgi:hypothetical protein
MNADITRLLQDELLPEISNIDVDELKRIYVNTINI